MADVAMDTTSGMPADEDAISQTGPAGGDAPVFAETDLLIERADLGPGCHTVIAADSRIPPHLARLPSTPYRPSATLGEPTKRRRQ